MLPLLLIALAVLLLLWTSLWTVTVSVTAAVALNTVCAAAVSIIAVDVTIV